MSETKEPKEIAGRPLLPTGWNQGELDLRGGPGFWTEVDRITRDAELVGHLDTAMADRPAPRTWVVMGDVESKAGVVAAALSLTRALTERGQAVVLIDADDHQPDLTRWAGRYEQEGWIDLVRYGASILTTSAPMEFPGKKSILMGVGSFCPTQVTPDEIGEILARLRRQADDLILVAPADENGRPWASRAELRLLCWDPLLRSRTELEAQIDELAAAEMAPTAVLAVGPEGELAAAGAAEATGDEEDVETIAIPVDAATPEAAQTPAETGETPAVEEPAASVAAATDAESEEPDTEPFVERIEEPAREIVSASADYAADADAAETKGEPTGEAAMEQPPVPSKPSVARRSTSGVFWGVAAAFVVIILGAVGYYVMVLRAPLGPAGTTVAETSQEHTAAAGTVGSLQETRPARAEERTGENSDSAGGTGATPMVTDAGPPEQMTESAGAGSESESAAASAEPAESSAGAAQGTAANEQSAARTTGAQRSSMEPFRGPVGQDGWALWVYSLADSSSAAAEVAQLESRGFQATYRAVQLAERGRWYRVYVGSFASRADAEAAVPYVKGELKDDWVQPARF